MDQLLHSKNNQKETLVLFDIDYTLFDTDIFKSSNLQTYELFKETLDVLKELSLHIILGVFSEGDITLQTRKLLETNIQHYFHEKFIYINLKKEEALAGILQDCRALQVFFVDDKLTILHKAKQYDPAVFTIWIKRGKYAEKQEPIKNFTPDAIIKDLREIIPVITAHK